MAALGLAFVGQLDLWVALKQRVEGDLAVRIGIGKDIGDEALATHALEEVGHDQSGTLGLVGAHHTHVLRTRLHIDTNERDPGRCEARADGPRPSTAIDVASALAGQPYLTS